MDTEAGLLRDAKTALENALAAGQDLNPVRVALGNANERYKTASTQIRKHAVIQKPKAKAKGKAAAKAAATPQA